MTETPNSRPAPKPDGGGRPRPSLVLATHNAHKLEEFQVMLPAFDLQGAGRLGLAEPDETGDDFHANALIKALAAATATNLPALADDSGLAVRGLDGAPGIHSARLAGPNGDFAAAMRNIIERLSEKFGGFGNADKDAAFIASLCLAFPDGAHCFFDGVVEGALIQDPRGERGFGYDPIFLPGGHQQTFGEMPPERKNAISHRAMAVGRFRAWLVQPSALRDRLLPQAG